METNGRSKAMRVLLGALLVALGALPVIQRLSALFADASHRAWPLLALALGLLGVWLVLAGTAWLAGAVKFAHAMLLSPWPLLLALVGAALVWRALVRDPRTRAHHPVHEDGMTRVPHGA